MTDNIIVFKKRHFSSFCTQCALFGPAVCLFFSTGLVRNSNLCLKGHRYMNTKSTILNTVLFYSQCLQLGSFSLPGFNWPFIPIDMEDFRKKASPENLQNRSTFFPFYSPGQSKLGHTGNSRVFVNFPKISRRKCTFRTLRFPFLLIEFEMVE